MRRFVFLLLALCSAPALAGQHAVYADPGGKKLIIDVADNGFARFVAEGEENYCLWRDGHLYLVNRDEGPLTVMRITDLVAAVDQVAAERGATAGRQAETAKAAMRLEPKGQRKVAGFDGQVFAMFGMKVAPETGIEFVTTREPALQPLGRAMEQFLLADMTLAHDAEMAAGTRAVFATGAPLDLGGQLVLVSVETIDVPASATALPAAPETMAEIIDTLKAGDPLEPLQAVEEPGAAPGEI
jgi:hypothetical protein